MMLLSAIYTAVMGDDSVGDFSKWRHFISHFSAGRGAESGGRFIHSYMAEISYCDWERALERSVKNYKRSYMTEELV